MTFKPAQGARRREPAPRFRAVSGRPLNRRVVMKAAAGVAAIAAAGGIGGPARPVIAQDDPERVTRARDWEPLDVGSATAAEVAGTWREFESEFPFFAIGASWLVDVGLWPVVEVQLSDGGAEWSETFRLAASNDRGGGPDATEQRLYTPLVHTYGASYARFRTTDFDGVPGVVSGLRFTYIDATDGPWEQDIASAPATFDIGANTTDTRTPPEIITREQWGANESYRFSSFGEIWPPEYATVQHIIVHHTATPNSQDIPTAIRSIYYYHAVTQGWGDIGYNYLVGRDGRIYQGRFGGQNVIGGHSFQYAVGSSGISIVGDFQETPVPDAAITGLVAIVAWVGRDLGPYGASDFLEAPNLPTITSHRDVNATECPGDFLYNDLPEIRDLVAATLDAGDLETPFPGGIIPGDRVTANTGDGSALNVRASAGAGSAIVGSLPAGAAAFVIDGPVTDQTANWYRIDAESGNVTGWAAAAFLLIAPIPPPPLDADDFPYGLNIFASASVYVRADPSTGGQVITTAAQGWLGFVLAGPIAANGYEWYQVRWENGTIGWSAKDFLAAAPFDDNPGGQFAVGDTAEAVGTLSIRARPGAAQTQIATLGAGGRLQITRAPVAVNDAIWYGVYTQNDDGGWVVESSLRAVGQPPTGRFTVGDTVRVTETLNLRSGASTGSTTIAAMPAGTTGEVIGGPATANGYTWWQLRTSLGTGWAVENWLVEAAGPGPDPNAKFEIGEGVRVTESLNLRSSPSTSSSVIAVLAAGTTGSVVDGPQAGSGYTWWRIDTASGTGWAAEDWLEATATDPNEALVEAIVRAILAALGAGS